MLERKTGELYLPLKRRRKEDPFEERPLVTATSILWAIFSFVMIFEAYWIGLLSIAIGVYIRITNDQAHIEEQRKSLPHKREIDTNILKEMLEDRIITSEEFIELTSYEKA